MPQPKEFIRGFRGLHGLKTKNCATEIKEMKRVAELEQQIRRIFNLPRRHKNIRNTRVKFFQACSSLDVIGDTAYAIETYMTDSTSYSEGMRYIMVYGLLQAIFLQQDAIKNLSLSLDMSFELPDDLKNIRELRNDATGHPTNRKNGKSFHHISRVTLSKIGFQMISTYPDKDSPEITTVSLENIIQEQARYAEQLLSEILEQIKKEENEHRSAYMEEKLREIFPSTLGYYFEKVREGVRKLELRDFGAGCFDEIVGYLKTFESKLKERGVEESIEYIQKDLEYPFEKVKAYLSGNDSIDQRATEIFLDYIQKQFDILVGIAKEIDEEYEQRV